MRILCLGMYGLAQGELSYEARMVHHLAAMGNDVDYWTDAPLDYSMEPVLKQPQTLKNFVFHEGKNALAKTPRQFHPLDVKRIIEKNGRERDGVLLPYDVIFTTSQTGIDMGVWLKQVLGVPLVVQILDLPYWRIDQTGPWELYKESVMPLPLLPTQLFDGYASEWKWWLGNLDNVDRVVAILDSAKDMISAYAKAFTGKDYASKISVCWHGSVDTDTFDHYFRMGGVQRKDQVLCLNRIDFHKGVDQTVAVCAGIQDIMAKAGRPAPQFVFASRGNQDWYEQAVQRFARQQLRDVRFTGWITNPEKIRLIRESKAVIDNEWPEGFGGCILGEATYCGTPSFAWDTKSKREVTASTNFPSTRLVEKGNIAKMASLAAETLEDFKETPEDAKEFVRKFRSNRSHAESVAKILREVVR